MSEHYRRGDPEQGCLLMMGMFLIFAIVVWGAAIYFGFWPILLFFTIIGSVILFGCVLLLSLLRPL